MYVPLVFAAHAFKGRRRRRTNQRTNRLHRLLLLLFPPRALAADAREERGELFFIWVKTVGEGKARGRVRIGEGN